VENNQFIRSEMLFGKEKIDLLKNKKVAIFGLGGVGGYVLEAMSRMGISNFILVDNDKVNISNLNRQILATHDSIGKYKTDVAKERILSINSNANVETYNIFYLKENADLIDLSKCDYVVDAIDTISAKIHLVEICNSLNIPIISSMGAGNKIDPSKIKICDLFKTENDPLAKVMRYELRKLGIKHLKVCFSNEIACNQEKVFDENTNKAIPASCVYEVGIFGFMIASEVIKDLIK